MIRRRGNSALNLFKTITNFEYIIMRFVVATLVSIWIFVAGCGGTSRYNNPYEDPRSQMEYRQWVTGTADKKFRANEFLRNENSWMQSPEQRAPIFRGYLQDVNLTNARLQKVRRKEKTIQARDFRESVGLFTSSTERTRKKSTGSQKRQSELTAERLRADAIRYNRFIKLRKERFKRLSK